MRRKWLRREGKIVASRGKKGGKGVRELLASKKRVPLGSIIVDKVYRY